MYKKSIMIIVLYLAHQINASASPLDWSWSFTQQQIEVTTEGFVDIYINVKNDSSSLNGLDPSGFSFNDGTFGYFGIFFNENNDPIFTTTLLGPPSIILGPGDEETFLAFSLYAHDNISINDQVIINPKFYVKNGFDSKFADSSLLINVQTVPNAPVIYLFMIGLIMILIKNYRICNVSIKTEKYNKRG